MAPSFLRIAAVVGMASIAVANPVPEPHVSATPTCVTYITSIATDDAFEATSTVYPSTVLSYDYVNCGGCELATTTVYAPFGRPGPVHKATTVTASAPLTVGTTLCELSGTPEPVCTSTINVRPTFDYGNTYTSYTKTVTTTVSETCDSGCASVEFVATTRFLGVGPERLITTTVDGISTATAYACATTA